MAKIVCIDTATAKTGISEVGDVISIHDDNVELTGPGYANAKIVQVDGITALEVRAILNAKIPETKIAHRLPVAGKWCFMEEKQVWKDATGNWCDLINRPKYALSLKNLAEDDITALADKSISVLTKQGLLNKTLEKIHLDTKNTIEVSDLNLATK